MPVYADQTCPCNATPCTGSVVHAWQCLAPSSYPLVPLTAVCQAMLLHALCCFLLRLSLAHREAGARAPRAGGATAWAPAIRRCCWMTTSSVLHPATKRQPGARSAPAAPLQPLPRPRHKTRAPPRRRPAPPPSSSCCTRRRARRRAGPRSRPLVAAPARRSAAGLRAPPRSASRQVCWATHLCLCVCTADAVSIDVPASCLPS